MDKVSPSCSRISVYIQSTNLAIREETGSWPKDSADLVMFVQPVPFIHTHACARTHTHIQMFHWQLSLNCVSGFIYGAVITITNWTSHPSPQVSYTQFHTKFKQWKSIYIPTRGKHSTSFKIQDLTLVNGITIGKKDKHSPGAVNCPWWGN